MNRRLFIIALTLATAFLLLVLQNKVFVGSQGLQAELVRPEPTTVEMVFRDAAGRPMPIAGSDALGDFDELIEEIKRRLDRDDPGPDIEDSPIPYVADSFAAVDDQTLRFELASLPESDEDRNKFISTLRTRLQGREYEQANKPRGLFYIPLGIDLRGGVEFTCRLYDRDNQVVPADEDVVKVLRDRLAARGLTEPQVFRLTSGDVQVVIPGGTQADAARTRKVLETTGRLEEREVLAIFQREGDRWDYVAKGDHNTYEGNPAWRPLPGPLEEYVVELPTGGYELTRAYWDEVWVQHGSKTKQFDSVVYPAAVQPGEQIERFYHLDKARLTGSDIEDAERGQGPNGGPAVNITYNNTGAPKHEEFANDVMARGRAGVGTGMIAISLDGIVESAPRIMGVSARNSQIQGQFTVQEVESLRTVLVAGSLAVTPRVTAERVVGPSLGQATIDKAQKAMFAGLLMILVVMYLYYRGRLGTVAVASLTVTVGLIFVILSIFSATLTLPGIAGLVLTVGMAVDANILIFERLREELAEDVDVTTGIENGYARAFITILDANLTTFITAFILYVVGTGPVQGFGLTLMVGIVTSMFGAIYVGRWVTGLLYHRVREAKVPGLFKPLRLPYTRMRYGALALSLVVGVVSWVMFFQDGDFDSHFDIDFTGGNMVQVVLEEPMEIDEVRAALAEAHREGAELLDPQSIQLLPYFADFGAAGGASRQWMFKGRDLEGARIERERAALEDQRARLFREVTSLENQQRDPTITEDFSQRLIDLRRDIDELDAEIAALTGAVEERQEAFQHQLSQAFGSKLRPEGSQIVAVASEGQRRLVLDIAVLGEPSSTALVRAEERLAESRVITAADAAAIAADDRPAVRLTLDYDEPPVPIEDLPEGDAVLAAIRGFLGEEAPPGLVLRAAEAYERAVDALATAGIAVDQPFPSSQHFSPLVGDQMKWRALLALLAAVACVLAYIAARFEFRYGIGAIVALVHDVVIAVGMLTLLDIRIDLNVIAALLTLIGYSLNDTIVVFDRIRENIRRVNAGLTEIIDISIAQTMSRTILTTGTTLGVVVILYFFGGEGVNAFSGTLLIGLILGTYSSVFVAAPVLVILNKGRPSASLVEAATVDYDADLRTSDEEDADAAAAKPAEVVDEEQGDTTRR